MKFSFFSLRAKLVLITVVIEIVTLGVFVFSSDRLIQQRLLEQVEIRLSEYALLLNAALAPALVEKNYSALQEILTESYRNKGMTYLILMDTTDKVVAAEGWPAGDALPVIDANILTSIQQGRSAFNTQLQLRLGGKTYGVLRLGINTQFIKAAQAGLLHQSLWIAGGAVLLSIGLLTAAGFWMTRHLSSLAAASRAVAEGHFDIALPVETHDEIGQLSNAFNIMAHAVQQRIEEQSASAARFHAIADYSYDWESWFSTEGKLLWVNFSVERETGYLPQECLDMQGFPFVLIDSEDRADVEAKILGLTGKKSGADLEFRLRRKNGDLVWMAAAWQPIFSELGAYLGVRCSIRNIVKLKQAESALLAHSEQLEKTVESRTSDLRATNKELEQAFNSLQQTQSQLVQAEKMASLGNLVAGISHEVNTPLGIGVTSASSLQEELSVIQQRYQDGSMTRSDMDAFLAHADQACTILLSNMARASNLIRSFKQVAVDQSSGEWRQVNLAHYFDDILISLRPKLKHTLVSVHNEADLDLSIYSQPGTLYQIVSNLVLNALTHAFESGQIGAIWLGAHRDGDYIEVSCKDDGKGIADADLPRVFEPFFTTRRGRGGTGLGLSIVYNLTTTLLHGEVSVQSKLGHGTTFVVRFPLTQREDKNDKKPD